MKKFLLALTVLASMFAFGAACKEDDGDSTITDNTQTVETELKTMDISLSSQSFDYDGNAHALAISGNLPENAVVAWQNNTRTEVGEQLVFATVKCKGYKEVSLKATLTVVGQDFPETLALAESSLSVDYGAAYAFALNDVDLLPEGYSLVETYVDTSSGEVLDSKPDFGGEFRYVLQVRADGYNTKVFYGELSIARPVAESVTIVNLPSVPIAKYTDKAALVPTVKWVPEVEVLPKGHQEVSVAYATADESRIKYENGAFVALDNAGDCVITVTITGADGATISQDYTITVADCAYYYEDFEDENKTLYQQSFKTEIDENGQEVIVLDKNGAGIILPKDSDTDYYGAFACVGTTSELVSEHGDHALSVSGMESFNVYYSYLEIDATPTGGWTAGTYRLEMEVTGDYAFTFWWTRNATDGAAYYLNANSGTLSNGEAVIEDGKIVIEFTLTASALGDTNVIRFAQSDRSAFAFTVDNILLIKTK